MKKSLIIGCGAVLGIVVMLIVVGAVWLFTAPEGGVRLPNEMEEYALRYLDDHKILDDSEELLAYYDVTLSSNGSEAAILTTKRVIYHKNGRNDSIHIADIEDIRHRQEAMVGDVMSSRSKPVQERP